MDRFIYEIWVVLEAPSVRVISFNHLSRNSSLLTKSLILSVKLFSSLRLFSDCKASTTCRARTPLSVEGKSNNLSFAIGSRNSNPLRRAIENISEILASCFSSLRYDIILIRSSPRKRIKSFSLSERDLSTRLYCVNEAANLLFYFLSFKPQIQSFLVYVQ